MFRPVKAENMAIESKTPGRCPGVFVCEAVCLQNIRANGFRREADTRYQTFGPNVASQGLLLRTPVGARQHVLRRGARAWKGRQLCIAQRAVDGRRMPRGNHRVLSKTAIAFGSEVPRTLQSLAIDLLKTRLTP